MTNEQETASNVQPTRVVEMFENIFIPLEDGRKLAARLWRPKGAEANPVPAIMEYMPYRKRDMMRLRDERIHHYLAAHGYACLRVDTSGAGDSDGLLRGEWEETELDDGVAAINWAATQPWCTGSVGMLGKSWSGFTCLNLAARHPTALKAIVPVCCGDDRYSQSLHYTGGCFLLEQLWWSDSTVMFNALPPDPSVVGERWLEMWQARLNNIKPWIDDWLDHQRRDEYWRRASICENWNSINCAVLAVGGWADYLSRSIPRLLENLTVPRWGLIGPWGHFYPHEGHPGPSIGFLQECVRFFDRFLKDRANGYDDTPAYRVWMQEYQSPIAENTTACGRWVAEHSWPSQSISDRTFALNSGSIDSVPMESVPLTHTSPLELGLTGSEWLCMGVPGELPGDQRTDDRLSLTFDSSPLQEVFEILGSVKLVLDCEVDQPTAQVVARLVDVAPDGTAARVNFAVLNLCHRDSSAEPTPVEPGKRYHITLPFPDVAHSFAPGHRIRLALSTSYWPVIWPAPNPVRLTVHTGTSTLALPHRPSGPDYEPATPSFETPEAASDVPITVLESKTISRHFERDSLTGETVITVICDGGAMVPARRIQINETGTVLGHKLTKTFRIGKSDPLSATAEFHQRFELERGQWQIAVETNTRMISSRDSFHIESAGKVWNSERVVFDSSWSLVKLRDLM